MTRTASKRLRRQVDRLVSSSGWPATARRLARHPELLGRRASRLLRTREAAARRDDDIELAALYRYHAALLQRCRAVGVAAAIVGEIEAAAAVPDLVHGGLASLRAYRSGGAEADLHQALARLAEAACLTLPGHPDRPAALSNLGIALVDRFDHDRAPRHLRSAVAVLDEALDWSPPGSAQMSAALANLGIALLAMTDVDTSGHCAGRAVDVLATAVDHAHDETERARRLDNLGVAYSLRYRTRRRPGDLDRAVTAHRAALPDRLRQRAAGWRPAGEEVDRVANLSTALAERYARRGGAGDLDWALELADQAMSATATTSPQLVVRAVNRALLLRDRFERDGELPDLDEAVSLLGEAVAATPPDDPDRGARIDQLATSLRIMALRRRSADDLREAVAIHRQALAAPLAAGDRCVVLNNLAGSVRALASSSDGPGQESLLREALETYRSALAAGQSRDDRASVRNNLGAVLLDLFAVAGQPGDADEAVRVLRRCVDATDRRSPQRSARLNNLGNAWRSRQGRTQLPEEARLARKAYQQGCSRASSRPAQDVLRCGVNWGAWAVRRHAWREAVIAFSAARRATDRLVAQQVTRPDKESWLGDVETISVGSAYCLAELAELPAAALCLEWGRARVLSEVLERDRADVRGLAHDHAQLADRFTAAAARVRSLANVSGQPEAPRAAPARAGRAGGRLLHGRDPLGAEAS